MARRKALKLELLLNVCRMSAMIILLATPLTSAAQSDFDANYPTLRKKFLELAQNAKSNNSNVQIESTAVPSRVTNDLFIDSVYIPSSVPSKNLIILTSGIHGVEAPAGSIIERSILSSCMGNAKDETKINTSNANVLIIHSMNPFGFKYGRRFNENNVDLNRNCYDYRVNPFPGSQIENPLYSQYQSFLENETSSASIIWNGLFHNRSLRESLSGQYQSAHGIYFGGDSVESECRTVEMLIESHLDGIRNVLHFDLHTGLGSKGISQVMVDPPPIDAAARKAFDLELLTLKGLFRAEDCKGVCAVQPPETDDFNTNGDITSWIYNAYPKMRTSGIVMSETIEIGTEWAPSVLPAIINENFCNWHSNECGPEKTLQTKTTLKNVFTLKDDTWRDQVARGSERICQALARFSNF